MNAILLTLALLAPLLIAGTADTNPPHDQTCWEYTGESWDDDRHGRYQQVPGTVGAGYSTDIDVLRNSKGQVIYKRVNEAIFYIDGTVRTVCELKLSEAMRAMEPFTYDVRPWEYKPLLKGQSEDHWRSLFRDASRQWIAAEACWREHE